MKTISVVIPAVPLPQRLGYLGEALASVAAQTLVPHEIIVVMDWEAKGAAWTRNKGLEMATGDFVAFLDDDDLLLPEHLEKLSAKQTETDADVVFPAYATEPEGWLPIPDFIGWEWTKDFRFIFPITTLVRREAALAVGGFAPDPGATIAAGEDWIFWNLLTDAGYKFVHLEERTWKWRMHDKHLSGQPWKNYEGHGVNPACGPDGL